MLSQSALDQFNYRARGAGGQRHYLSLQVLFSPLRMSQIGGEIILRDTSPLR